MNDEVTPPMRTRAFVQRSPPNTTTTTLLTTTAATAAAAAAAAAAGSGGSGPAPSGISPARPPRHMHVRTHSNPVDLSSLERFGITPTHAALTVPHAHAPPPLATSQSSAAAAAGSAVVHPDVTPVVTPRNRLLPNGGAAGSSAPPSLVRSAGSGTVSDGKTIPFVPPLSFAGLTGGSSSSGSGGIPALPVVDHMGSVMPSDHPAFQKRRSSAARSASPLEKSTSAPDLHAVAAAANSNSASASMASVTAGVANAMAVPPPPLTTAAAAVAAANEHPIDATYEWPARHHPASAISNIPRLTFSSTMNDVKPARHRRTFITALQDAERSLLKPVRDAVPIREDRYRLTFCVILGSFAAHYLLFSEAAWANGNTSGGYGVAVMSLVMLGLIEFSALRSHNFTDAQHGYPSRWWSLSVAILLTLRTAWRADSLPILLLPFSWMAFALDTNRTAPAGELGVIEIITSLWASLGRAMQWIVFGSLSFLPLFLVRVITWYNSLHASDVVAKVVRQIVRSLSGLLAFFVPAVIGLGFAALLAEANPAFAVLFRDLLTLSVESYTYFMLWIWHPFIGWVVAPNPISDFLFPYIPFIGGYGGAGAHSSAASTYLTAWLHFADFLGMGVFWLVSSTLILSFLAPRFRGSPRIFHQLFGRAMTLSDESALDPMGYSNSNSAAPSGNTSEANSRSHSPMTPSTPNGTQSSSHRTSGGFGFGFANGLQSMLADLTQHGSANTRPHHHKGVYSAPPVGAEHLNTGTYPVFHNHPPPPPPPPPPAPAAHGHAHAASTAAATTNGIASSTTASGDTKSAPASAAADAMPVASTISDTTSRTVSGVTVVHTSGAAISAAAAAATAAAAAAGGAAGMMRRPSLGRRGGLSDKSRRNSATKAVKDELETLFPSQFPAVRSVTRSLSQAVEWHVPPTPGGTPGMSVPIIPTASSQAPAVLHLPPDQTSQANAITGSASNPNEPVVAPSASTPHRSSVLLPATPSLTRGPSGGLERDRSLVSLPPGMTPSKLLPRPPSAAMAASAVAAAAVATPTGNTAHTHMNFPPPASPLTHASSSNTAPSSVAAVAGSTGAAAATVSGLGTSIGTSGAAALGAGGRRGSGPPALVHSVSGLTMPVAGHLTPAMLGGITPAFLKLVPKLDRAGSIVTQAPNVMYFAAKDTLYFVNAVFAVYLSVDVYHLIYGVPIGVSQSEFTRSGVFTFTISLFLTSCTLGWIFAGRLNFDHRSRELQRLAMYWLTQSGMLAALTFYRIYCYISWRGATDWIWAGVASVAVVTAGLFIVAIKIYQRKTLWWMVRVFLFFVSLAIGASAILPVDYLCVSYNVHLIENGHFEAAQQLHVHRLTPEASVPLLSLLNHTNPMVTLGIAAKIMDVLDGHRGPIARQCPELNARLKREARYTVQYVTHEPISARSWMQLQYSIRYACDAIEPHFAQLQQLRSKSMEPSELEKRLYLLAYQPYEQPRQPPSTDESVAAAVGTDAGTGTG